MQIISEKKKKKPKHLRARRSKSKKRPILNVVCTKYKIVRYIGEKIFNWKLNEKTNQNWDVCWVDQKVPYTFLGKMKPYQRINHFPGMFYLSKKNYLCNNLNRIRNIFPDKYNFYPQTWLLPADSTKLKKYIYVRSLLIYYLINIREARRIKHLSLSRKHLAKERAFFLLKDLRKFLY